MEYIELTVPVVDGEQAEVLTAELGEFPFDSFVEEPGVGGEPDLLKAYILASALPDCKARVDELLASQGVVGARYIAIEPRNWNALWESQFDPVDVEGRLTIRAPFHAPAAATAALEVVIMPRMSFGTGHHATTWLMSAEMLDHDFVGKRVLDMGSGTGVLAILAAKLGAACVDAIDIDEWAFSNSQDNIAANDVGQRVTPILGDAARIGQNTYDTVLANINRNILLADIPAYVAALASEGELIVSGILEADIPAIERRAIGLGLKPNTQRLREGWAVLSFRRHV